jgi:hypothetical protein
VNIEVAVPISVDISIQIEDTKEKSPFWPKWVQPSKVRQIQQLPIFSIVHEMVLMGHPDIEIARIIQDHGCMTEIETATVVTYLGHYRATVPKSLILMHNTPKHVLDAKAKLEEHIDIISEQDWLYRSQKHRLLTIFKREEQFGMVIPNMEKEIDLAARLLEKSAKFRKDAGFNEPEIYRAAKREDRFGVNLDRIYSKEGITEKLSDPKSRLKILGAVESLLAIAQRKSEVIDIEKKMAESDELVELDPIDPGLLEEMNGREKE